MEKEFIPTGEQILWKKLLNNPLSSKNKGRYGFFPPGYYITDRRIVINDGTPASYFEKFPEDIYTMKDGVVSFSFDIIKEIKLDVGLLIDMYFLVKPHEKGKIFKDAIGNFNSLTNGSYMRCKEVLRDWLQNLDDGYWTKQELEAERRYKNHGKIPWILGLLFFSAYCLYRTLDDRFSILSIIGIPLNLGLSFLLIYLFFARYTGAFHSFRYRIGILILGFVTCAIPNILLVITETFLMG